MDCLSCCCYGTLEIPFLPCEILCHAISCLMCAYGCCGSCDSEHLRDRLTDRPVDSKSRYFGPIPKLCAGPASVSEEYGKAIAFCCGKDPCGEAMNACEEREMLLREAQRIGEGLSGLIPKGRRLG